MLFKRHTQDTHSKYQIVNGRASGGQVDFLPCAEQQYKVGGIRVQLWDSRRFQTELSHLGKGAFEASNRGLSKSPRLHTKKSKASKEMKGKNDLIG